MTKHHLKPLFDQVVIKELEPGQMRKSGLVVPPGTSDQPPQHGIVLDVGQGVLAHRPPAAGDPGDDGDEGDDRGGRH